MHQDGGKSTSFAELLWRVHEEVPELKRLRFIVYPRDFSDEALDVMAAPPNLPLSPYSSAERVKYDAPCNEPRLHSRTIRCAT